MGAKKTTNTISLDEIFDPMNFGGGSSEADTILAKRLPPATYRPAVRQEPFYAIRREGIREFVSRGLISPAAAIGMESMRRARLGLGPLIASSETCAELGIITKKARRYAVQCLSNTNWFVVSRETKNQAARITPTSEAQAYWKK